MIDVFFSLHSHTIQRHHKSEVVISNLYNGKNEHNSRRIVTVVFLIASFWNMQKFQLSIHCNATQLQYIQ